MSRSRITTKMTEGRRKFANCQNRCSAATGHHFVLEVVFRNNFSDYFKGAVRTWIHTIQCSQVSRTTKCRSVVVNFKNANQSAGGVFRFQLWVAVLSPVWLPGRLAGFQELQETSTHGKQSRSRLDLASSWRKRSELIRQLLDLTKTHGIE